MNRKLLLISIMLLAASSVSAQDIVSPNKPVPLINSAPGYITINELTGGPGLGIVNAPYSKYFFGFTTIHGYQIDQSFVIAAGTGLSAYNGGTMIPLFMDFRYRFLISTFTPYVVGDGGVLFKLSGGVKLFINPAVGVRYTINRKIGLNFSTGLFVQSGAGVRDSYINFKLGVTFIPK
jgi:opacity protein-like surface antigen